MIPATEIAKLIPSDVLYQELLSRQQGSVVNVEDTLLLEDVAAPRHSNNTRERDTRRNLPGIDTLLGNFGPIIRPPPISFIRPPPASVDQLKITNGDLGLGDRAPRGPPKKGGIAHSTAAAPGNKDGGARGFVGKKGKDGQWGTTKFSYVAAYANISDSKAPAHATSSSSTAIVKFPQPRTAKTLQEQQKQQQQKPLAGNHDASLIIAPREDFDGKSHPRFPENWICIANTPGKVTPQQHISAMSNVPNNHMGLSKAELAARKSFLAASSSTIPPPTSGDGPSGEPSHYRTSSLVTGDNSPNKFLWLLRTSAPELECETSWKLEALYANDPKIDGITAIFNFLQAHHGMLIQWPLNVIVYVLGTRGACGMLDSAIIPPPQMTVSQYQAFSRVLNLFEADYRKYLQQVNLCMNISAGCHFQVGTNIFIDGRLDDGTVFWTFDISHVNQWAFFPVYEDAVVYLTAAEKNPDPRTFWETGTPETPKDFTTLSGNGSADGGSGFFVVGYKANNGLYALTIVAHFKFDFLVGHHVGTTKFFCGLPDSCNTQISRLAEHLYSTIEDWRNGATFEYTAEILATKISGHPPLYNIDSVEY